MRPDQQGYSAGAEHRARPHCGRERPNARFAHPQQVNRNHHGKHRECSAGERLHRGEADQKGQVAVPPNGAHTLADLGQQARPAGGRSWRSLVVNPHHHCRRPQRAAGGYSEHGSNPGELE